MADPATALAAVPYLVGFTPSESIVLLALRPPRGRVVLTLRQDLPPVGFDEAVAEVLTTHAAQRQATGALLVVYTEDPSARPRAELVAAVRRRLDERDVELRDVLLVRAGRWWSYVCDDTRCCPPEGKPVADAPADLVTSMALEGRRPLPDRAALERSVAPVTGPRRASAEEALTRVSAELRERASSGQWQRTVERFETCLARCVDGEPISADDAARIILGMRDVRARDTILAMAGEDADDDSLAVLLRFLQELAPQALPPEDPPVLTALAWVAWAAGDGGLANVAVERALASDRDYSLAGLVRSGLDFGIPPSSVRRTSTTVGADLARLHRRRTRRSRPR